MNKFLVLILAILIPAISFANGGDQRVVENKYFVSLSRAPFTPRVGVKTSFLASFVDIEKNKLINEDILVKVRIAKFGEVPKGNFIFTKDNIPVTGGVLELPYTFTETGLHEIFFDFAFASNPQKIYEVPDFLIDVQRSSEQANGKHLISGLLGVTIGIVIGRFIKLR